MAAIQRWHFYFVFGMHYITFHYISTYQERSSAAADDKATSPNALTPKSSEFSFPAEECMVW